jgi:transposase-like protein
VVVHRDRHRFEAAVDVVVFGRRGIGLATALLRRLIEKHDGSETSFSSMLAAI